MQRLARRQLHYLALQLCTILNLPKEDVEGVQVTLHYTPDTRHPKTLNPTKQAPPTGALNYLNTAPWTQHPSPYTLHPTPYTLRPTPYTLHPTPHTLHSESQTPNPKPWTADPKP